ncbi:MAG: transcription termination factor NusA [bacterium]
MNFGDEILDTLREIAAERDIDEDIITRSLEETLEVAFKKVHGRVDGIEVKIGEKGKINSYIELEVVENVEEPDLEISLPDAQQIEPAVKIGDIVKKKLFIEELSRGTILNIRTLLGQKIREAEKERVLTEYNDKINEIVSGQVQQVGKNSIIVDLGRAEGMLELKDLIPSERWHQGQRIKALVTGIQEKGKIPFIKLSRSDNEFLVKLFHNEVPEIYDGIIQIMSVSREPGERAKVAVWSKDERIDPVGACVGMKGIRVQSIVKELSGEKIDIVLWSQESEVFITRALAPAVIEKINLDEKEKAAKVIVNDDQLSLAIGKSGQNARLASKLTGWTIDICSISESRDKRRQDLYKKISLDNLGLIPPDKIEILKQQFKTVFELHQASEEEILSLPGIEEQDIPLLRKAIEQVSEISDA